MIMIFKVIDESSMTTVGPITAKNAILNELLSCENKIKQLDNNSNDFAMWCSSHATSGATILQDHLIRLLYYL